MTSVPLVMSCGNGLLGKPEAHINPRVSEPACWSSSSMLGGGRKAGNVRNKSVFGDHLNQPPHFAWGETEVQRSQLVCPRLQHEFRVEPQTNLPKAKSRAAPPRCFGQTSFWVYWALLCTIEPGSQWCQQWSENRRWTFLVLFLCLCFPLCKGRR